MVAPKRVAAALLAWIALVVAMSGCASSPPEQPGDVCAVFREKPGWFRSITGAEKRWEIPTSTLMAVMHRESSYISDAQPARQKVLWIVPWTRPSSAYGYAQATDETWSDYLRDTRNRFADRDDFDDAIDFIGWYLDRASRELGIARRDAHRHYLAYHEGLTGYRRGSWRSNEWLQGAAGKVSRQAARYAAQLKGCRSKLAKRRWWWPD